MSPPALRAVELAGGADRPLLIVGPSLGTSAVTLWRDCAALLAADFHVVGWDLPGHGVSPATAEPLRIGDLADGVMIIAESVLAGRGEPESVFSYAGDSVGGAVGLQVALDHPDRLRHLVVVCSGAKIGTPEDWRHRADLVRASGPAIMVERSSERWFAPGFVDARPEIAVSLLDALRQTDGSSYARVCEALADFDVRDRLPEISCPVLAIGGAHDVAAPTALSEEIAREVQHGTVAVLPDCGHLAPAEKPRELARLLAELRRDTIVTDPYADGMRVRRAVLGDDHVDRAAAATTEFTADFQDLITRYAWGTVWTRPGLDRRSRSMITLTALVAGGHQHELALHVRAARRNGLTPDEIKEVLLQSAIYCSVPAANSAFTIAQQTLTELGDINPQSRRDDGETP